MFGFFSKKKAPAKKPDAEPKKAAAKPADAKAAPPSKVEGKADKAAAKAKAALEATAPARPKPEPVSAGESLERAKAKLATKGTGGRAALIEQAMAVHQQQAKKLDSLPEETRMRLRAMALKAFVLPGEKKDKSKLN